VLKLMIIDLDNLTDVICQYNALVNPDTPKIDSSTLRRLNAELDDFINGDQDLDIETHKQVTQIVDRIGMFLSRYNINVDDFRTLELVDDNGTVLIYFGDYTHADLSQQRHCLT